jgi:hypothetical protein
MIPISAVKTGMFFTYRNALYYVTRLKANGKPEICKMLYRECRWLPPQTAYGVDKAGFHSPDVLVNPLANEEVLKWNRVRFVLETQAMVKDGDRQALRKLAVKALAPAARRLREIGVQENWAKPEMYKSLYGGPDNVEKTATALIAQHHKAEEAECTVQALLADLDEAIQAEARDFELDQLWELLSRAQQHFEFAVTGDISDKKRQEVIQSTRAGCLEWVRKQVAREKERRAA